MFVCPECGLAAGQGGACPADGTQLAPPSDDALIGTTLGPYRVARLLGVGGMGRVYKGVHPSIGSRVAIKVLSYECAQRQDLVERFFSEARAVNLIRHESIVNVLDLAMLPDGRPYIIMEYLDGLPLADLLSKAGPLPLGSLARLCAEVLDALGAAHAKGIVHRDLKPDNIYVTPAGRPKVLDFGIAKLQQQQMGMGSATQTGSLLGTPHYMSPEQAMGRPVDLRTDIYAMGVILYECATGRRPFHADALYDLLRQHVEVAPPPPRTMRPDMPPAYESVILSALAKDPAQRPQNAAALATALQGASQGLGPEAWAQVTPGTASQIAAQRGSSSWPSTQQSWPGGSGPGSTPVPATDPGAGRGMQMPPGGYPPTPPPGPSPMNPYGPGAQASMGTPPPGTVSSGQMVHPPPTVSSGSGKGLWIGIAVIAVVAGGGSAAYFATRGGTEHSAREQEVATADDQAEKHDDTPPKSDDKKADDPGSASGTASASGAASASAGDDDDTKADDAVDKQMAEAEKQLDQLDKTADEALKKLDATGASTNLGTPPPPKPTTGGSTGSAPITLSTQNLPLPAGFDPKKFDVTGYYATAEATAKQIWPDAKLVRIDADGVYPSGLADLTLDDEYYARYWFSSAANSKRPANLPIGAPYKTTCNLQIMVTHEGIELLPMDWECTEIQVPPPKCSFKEAWTKAVKAGAPGGNAVAQVSYMANIVSKQIRWFFTIGDAYDDQIPDGC